MNQITQCFENHHVALTRSLLGARFTIDQANQFLPVATSSLFASMQNNSVYNILACLLDRSTHDLVRKVDVSRIAYNTGLNPVKATEGLQAMGPILLEAFRYCSEKNSNHYYH